MSSTIYGLALCLLGVGCYVGMNRPAALIETFARFQAGFLSSEDFHRISWIFINFDNFHRFAHGFSLNSWVFIDPYGFRGMVVQVSAPALCCDLLDL